MTRRSATTLLIDDDAASRLATIDVLAVHGHAPVLATSAEQAADMLMSPHRVDVAILDIKRIGCSVVWR